MIGPIRTGRIRPQGDKGLINNYT